MSAPKKRQDPKVGSVFRKIFKGTEYTMEVVEREGQVRFRVMGVDHQSPTAAARAVCINPTNGWRFWGMD